MKMSGTRAFDELWQALERDWSIHLSAQRELTAQERAVTDAINELAHTRMPIRGILAMAEIIEQLGRLHRQQMVASTNE